MTCLELQASRRKNGVSGSKIESIGMNSPQITITLNGNPRQVQHGCTLAELIASLDLSTDRLAAELNKRVIRRADHSTTELQDGDRVEIVTLVGGG